MGSVGGNLAIGSLMAANVFATLLFIFMLINNIFFTAGPMLAFFVPTKNKLLTNPVCLLLVTGMRGH